MRWGRGPKQPGFTVGGRSSHVDAHDPAHRGIAPEAVGNVHVLVAGKAAEHRLTELGDQAAATVSPGARVGEDLGRHLREAQSVVEFAKREQSGIGGDGGAVELQLQAAVERDPQPHPLRLTRRVVHPPPPK
jgi:hypothetical protein